MPKFKCRPGCSCGLHEAFTQERINNLSLGHASPKNIAFLYGEGNIEHLRQLAAKNRGQVLSEEYRRKISQGLTGRRLSDDHRRRISEANQDPELKSRRRATRIARRKPPETYRQVHKRLVTDRGSARNHLCIDCGRTAKDWSHNCYTWENVAQEISGKRLAFSTDLSAYRPRCQSCHRHLDSQPMPWV